MGISEVLECTSSFDVRLSPAGGNGWIGGVEIRRELEESGMSEASLAELDGSEVWPDVSIFSLPSPKRLRREDETLTHCSHAVQRSLKRTEGCLRERCLSMIQSCLG